VMIEMVVFHVGQNHDLSLTLDRSPRCEFMDWFYHISKGMTTRSGYHE